MRLLMCRGVNLFAQGDSGPPNTWAQLVFEESMVVTFVCAPLAYYVSPQVTDALNDMRNQSGLPGSSILRLYADSVPPGTTMVSPCDMPLPRDTLQTPFCWRAADVLWMKDISLNAVTQGLEHAAAWVPAYYRVRTLNAFVLCENLADMECVVDQGLSQCPPPLAHCHHRLSMF